MSHAISKNQKSIAEVIIVFRSNCYFFSSDDVIYMRLSDDTIGIKLKSRDEFLSSAADEDI